MAYCHYTVTILTEGQAGKDSRANLPIIIGIAELSDYLIFFQPVCCTDSCIQEIYSLIPGSFRKSILIVSAFAIYYFFIYFQLLFLQDIIIRVSQCVINLFWNLPVTE